ncbi:hypothetical protein O181_054715 [Austropuccinia psidii MF-1]|uniref:Uncharacterized protein n=1 Tax=Austropuccinia psidii MF-1 TaxID=1389203 RepID=A0A9Q3E9C1_9BASI|nr:hypothetical protein [Austropuccinia psidii MF-1]
MLLLNVHKTCSGLGHLFRKQLKYNVEASYMLTAKVPFPLHQITSIIMEQGTSTLDYILSGTCFIKYNVEASYMLTAKVPFPLHQITSIIMEQGTSTLDYILSGTCFTMTKLSSNISTSTTWFLTH